MGCIMALTVLLTGMSMLVWAALWGTYLLYDTLMTLLARALYRRARPSRAYRTYWH